LPAERKGEWPQGLTLRQIRTLKRAGYDWQTVRQATAEELAQIRGVGDKTVLLITGVDLRARREQPPEAARAVQEATGRLPPKVLWPEIAAALGERPDVGRLTAAYGRWVARGYNPQNYAGWLLDWAVNGVPDGRGARRGGLAADGAAEQGSPEESEEALQERIARAEARLEQLRGGTASDDGHERSTQRGGDGLRDLPGGALAGGRSAGQPPELWAPGALPGLSRRGAGGGAAGQELRGERDQRPAGRDDA
jgi:hypothetical protein